MKAPRRAAAASFGRVLEDVESAHAAADGLGRPLEVALLFEDARSDEAGAAFDQALAFVEDTAEPTTVLVGAEPQPSAPPSDDPQAIATELGLEGATSLAALQHARRRFMWANHPDRRPDVPAALANRRGAIANMLIDQAEAALAAPPARRRARG